MTEEPIKKFSMTEVDEEKTAEDIEEKSVDKKKRKPSKLNIKNKKSYQTDKKPIVISDEDETHETEEAEKEQEKIKEKTEKDKNSCKNKRTVHKKELTPKKEIPDRRTDRSAARDKKEETPKEIPDRRAERSLARDKKEETSKEAPDRRSERSLARDKSIKSKKEKKMIPEIVEEEEIEIVISHKTKKDKKKR